MRRRDFIKVIVGSGAGWPLVARAQQSVIPVIGFLGSASPEPSRVKALWGGLGEAEYVEGRNCAIEFRWAEGQYGLLPALAAALVARRVSLIIASGPPAARAAKAATSTIPIVFTTGSDPIVDDLVQSLSRPGGNVTGVTLFTVNLGAKRLSLLRDLVPNATTIAILINPNSSLAEPEKKDVQVAVDTLGLKLHVVKATSEEELNNAFTIIAQFQTDALVVGNDPFFNSQRYKIAALAARYRVPAIYEWREYAEAGGLMSYGTIAAEVYRQAGVYAGRILRGAQPATLPVIQPTKFELVINAKSAKALGIKIPPDVFTVADEVIE